jgi:nucleotide-binding universal stress UspA family protein
MRQRFRHLLAPVDFSETSAYALEYACQMAALVGAKLTVIHVANPKQLDESLSGLDAIERLGGALNSPPDPQSYVPAFYQREDVEKSLHSRMQKMLDALELSGCETTTALVEGYPSLEIVNYAKAHDVDLIVMGTHGRGPIGHLLLGSVAENVVRRAHCPVLTVRRPT